MTTNLTPSTIPDLQREVRLLTAGIDRKSRALREAQRDVKSLQRRLRASEAGPRQPLAVEQLEAAIREHHARVTVKNDWAADAKLWAALGLNEPRYGARPTAQHDDARTAGMTAVAA